MRLKLALGPDLFTPLSSIVNCLGNRTRWVYLKKQYLESRFHITKGSTIVKQCLNQWWFWLTTREQEPYRHIDLHFIREKTEAGELMVKYVPGTKQWADILKKALPPMMFTELQSKLVEESPTGAMEPPPGTWREDALDQQLHMSLGLAHKS